MSFTIRHLRVANTSPLKLALCPHYDCSANFRPPIALRTPETQAGDMAWAFHREGSYERRLTDGYIGRAKKFRRISRAGRLSYEQMMADHLYRLALRAVRSTGPLRSSPLDVWVIGNDSWSAEPLPDLFAAIREEDSDTRYRVIIAGIDYSSIRLPFFSNWGNWLRHSGMVKKKRHEDVARFRSAGTELLRAIHDRYREIGKPSSLAEFGLPVASGGLARQH